MNFAMGALLLVVGVAGIIAAVFECMTYGGIHLRAREEEVKKPDTIFFWLYLGMLVATVFGGLALISPENLTPPQINP